MTESKFDISWIDSGREAQEKPDPRYPNGIEADMTQGGKGCVAELPYPAPRCGTHVVVCKECGFRAGVTAAGRVDDPRSVKLPCKPVLKISSNASSMDLIAPGAKPVNIIDPIPDVPIVQGPHGRAWICNYAEGKRQRGIAEGADAGLDHWIIEAPWAHPAWHSYSIVLIHLRPIAGDRSPTLCFPHATHQFWVWVLDPTKNRRALLANGLPDGHWMSPVNFSAQFTEITDELARERIRDTVQLICDGKLSPDADHQRDWVRLFNNSMIKEEFR